MRLEGNRLSVVHDASKIAHSREQLNKFKYFQAKMGLIRSARVWTERDGALFIRGRLERAP